MLVEFKSRAYKNMIVSAETLIVVDGQSVDMPCQKRDPARHPQVHQGTERPILAQAASTQFGPGDLPEAVGSQVR